MNKLSFKTKFLNRFREISKLNVVEKFLLKRTQGKGLGNFFVKLIPNYYQYPKNTKRVVERGGVNFSLDISDYMEYVIYYGVAIEPREKLYKLIKDKMIVLDIGANIGETALNFAKNNPNGQVIGFEPVPYIHDRLIENISLNNFKNIKIENVAISNKKEMLHFDIPTNNNSGGVRMRKDSDNKKYGATQEVPAMTLDFYLEQSHLDNVDFIKVDVEGFEMNVLRGAEQTLNKFKPTLFMEVDDAMLKEQGATAQELLEFISAKGYDMINASTNQKIDLKTDFNNCHFDVLATA